MKLLKDIFWVVCGFIISALCGVLTILYAGVITITSKLGATQTQSFKLIRAWAHTLNFLTRTKVKIHHVENIPSQGCLFIFNHLSLFDIPILFAKIPRITHFGAKAELLKVPFFGGAMNAVGALPINRGNRPEAIQTLNIAKARMEIGETFALAAEGTRQKKPEIGEFKSGPFILAIQAHAPIVPIVLVGPDKIAPKGRLWVNLRTVNKVDMIFLPPISTDGKKLEDRKKMKDLARLDVIKTYQQFS